jgi:hypothetical protein
MQIMTKEQRTTLSLLLPNAVPTTDMIVPRGNLPMQLYAEIQSSDAAKLLVAGQRGMGKTTELLRLADLLNDSDFLPVFLQFGAQGSITQSGLLLAMAQELFKHPKSKLDSSSLKSLIEWYDCEEVTSFVEEGVEGEAGVGGDLIIARAKGKLQHQTKTKTARKRKTSRDVRSLLTRFNSLVEKARRGSKKRIVFIVDDIDKVQDASSIENTFIHAAHFMGQIDCPCIFTVPITYATSSYLRIAALPYTGIHRVPAVALFDQSGKPREEAFQFMRKVFQLRMPYNPLEEHLLRKVFELSGGVLIDAMRMLRGICKSKILDPSLTVDDALVEKNFQYLVDDYKFAFDRPLLWKKLSILCKASNKQSMMTDDSLLELLYKMIVIEYWDQMLWFDLHPAARRLYEQNAALIDEAIQTR